MREVFPSWFKKRYLEKPFNLMATYNKPINGKMGTSKSIKYIFILHSRGVTGKLYNELYNVQK